MDYSVYPKVETTIWRDRLEFPARHAVAIVGSHPNGRDGVPWDDPAVEIWLFNEAPLKTEKYPRWDALLQIHGPEVYSAPNNWVNPDYWPWLQESHGKPIYMQEVDPRVPDSARYPLEEILEMVPYHYLRSSPAMALALAIYLGYERIYLFGSELTSNTEYAYQATNLAFWIGFAHGRGIDLELRCWLDEFNQRIYGYEGELQLDRAKFAARLEENETAFKTNKGALAKLKERLDAAMLANEYDKVAQLSIELENVAMTAGETFGGTNEARRYAEKDAVISRQEFERCAAQAQKDAEELKSWMEHAGGKCEYVWNVWRNNGNIAALEQLRAFLKEKGDFAFNLGVKAGEYRENIYYMLEYDKALQAAGGVRALGKPEEYAGVH
jgi:hypothetical protein